MERFNKKLMVLTKPNWNVEEISIWCEVSTSVAEDIKNAVLQESGSIPADINKKRRSVSADEVIKFYGGNSRLEEIKILSTAMHSIVPIIVLDEEEGECDEQVI